MNLNGQQIIQENKRLQKENCELLQHIFRLGCQLFMQTESYRKVKEIKNKKCFNSEEQQHLHTEIYNAFTKLIQIIREACPNLTDEDIIFCCLSQDLNSSAIYCCMGYIGKQPINQRKYRIKKKMKEEKCDTLFDLIFNNKYGND